MILLTGGSGLLGKELQKHIDCLAPPRQILDITKPILPKTDLIIHAAAYTDVVKAEKEKENCFNVNVIGTRLLANSKRNMIYISTDYVFDGHKGNYKEKDYPNPKNFYSLTKLMGEYEALTNPKCKIIRCSFKPNPFKHEYAFTDQFISGDYVNVIAPEIARAVSLFDKLPRIIHIGTGRKCTFDLAKQTRDVKPIKTSDIKDVLIPKDVSMDCSLWESIKNDNRVC